jgi:hypothetical protein
MDRTRLEKGNRITFLRKETYGMAKNKAVWPGTGRHMKRIKSWHKTGMERLHEERKDCIIFIHQPVYKIIH